MNWKIINKWFYKTILPIIGAVLLVVISVMIKNNGIALVSIIGFVQPLLALIDKLVKDVKTAQTDAQQVASDMSTNQPTSVKMADASTVANDAQMIVSDTDAALKELQIAEKEMATMGKGDSQMSYSKLSNTVDYSWHREGVNMETGRQGNKIDMIILHHNASTNFNAVPAVWVSRPAGAHYQVGNFADGIKNTLAEEDTGYHAANYSVNLRSIGIEHVDATGAPGWTIDPETVENGARLIADIASRHSIPLDRSHIKGHDEVSLLGTSCPVNLPVDAMCARAKQIQEQGGEGSLVMTPTPQPQPAQPAQPSVIQQARLLVRVDKSIAAVRSQPDTSSSLAGSQILSQGDEFYAIGTVQGQNIQGNNGIWYRSQYGNYVSSNGLTVINGGAVATPQSQSGNHGAGRYYVYNTDGGGLHARRSPTTSSAIVPTSYGSIIPEGSPVDVVNIVQGQNINGNTDWAQSVSGAYESMAFLH